MKLYAALDVSLSKTAVCVMDHDGGLVREAEVPTCPNALAAALKARPGQLERVGLEAGPMSEWPVRGLASHGVEAVLMETRQAKKALSAMTVKTDRNDARGLAWARAGILRQQTPRDAAAKDVEDRIDDLAHLPLAMPAAAACRWHERPKNQPLRLGHIASITQPARLCCARVVGST